MNKEKRNVIRATLQRIIDRSKQYHEKNTFESVEKILIWFSICSDTSATLKQTTKLDKIVDIYWLYKDLKNFLIKHIK